MLVLGIEDLPGLLGVLVGETLDKRVKPLSLPLPRDAIVRVLLLFHLLLQGLSQHVGQVRNQPVILHKQVDADLNAFILPISYAEGASFASS